MSASASSISSYDEIQDCAAEAGFVLFGIREGVAVPDRAEILARGDAACEILQKGQQLIQSSPSTVDDKCLLQQFISFAQRKRVSHDQIGDIAKDAGRVRTVLRNLLANSEVPHEELECAILFFQRLYRST